MAVVVVVAVGVMRRHLLDAGRYAPHRLDVRLRGCPAPRPSSSALPSLRGSRAPPYLLPGVYAALPPLALGPLPGPCAFFPLPTSWVPPYVTCALARTASARILPVPVPMSLAAPPFVDRSPLRSMRSVAARLGALLASLRVLPVPLPFIAVCLVSCRPLPALCPSPLLLASAPCPPLRPRSLPHAPRPVPCACPWALPLSPPVPRPVHPWPAPCPVYAPSPPPRIRRRMSCCRCSCGSVMPGGVGLAAGGRTGRGLPLGKAAFGGYGLGWLLWVFAGAGVGAVRWPLPAPRCGCGGSWRGARGPRWGYPMRWRRAGGRGVVGRGRSVACWARGLSSLRVWGPLRGRHGRVRGLGGRGGLLDQRGPLGRQLGVRWGRPGLPSQQPNRHHCLRQPPLLTLSEGLTRVPRGDGGGGAGPALVAFVPLGGAIGVRHHCYPGRHAWRQACLLHYLLVHLWCAVGSAVQCSAGGRGGEGGGAGSGVGPAWAGAGGHPSALGREVGEPRGPHATAPSLGQGSGLWPPGVFGWP